VFKRKLELNFIAFFLESLTSKSAKPPAFLFV